MPTPAPFDATLINDRIHLRLFGAARVHLERDGWRVENMIDRFWRFYFNESDGAWIESNGEKSPLSAKVGYFIPSRVEFSGRVEAPVNHFYIHFDVLGLSEGVRRELFARPFAAPASPAVRNLAQRAATEFDGPSMEADLDFSSQIQLKALLYSALAAYLHAIPQARLQRAQQRQQAYAPLEPALNYIESHLTEPLAVPSLAVLCHLSEDYFIRRFRQSMGQSPGAYIQENRVTLAAQRLLFSDDTIESIAHGCGFGNRFYFSRVFKAHTGISPAAYRGTPRL